MDTRISHTRSFAEIMVVLHTEFGASAVISQTLHRNIQGRSFQDELAIGRDHMVGPQCPLEAYLASHAQQADPWQKIVFDYLQRQPQHSLEIYSRSTRQIWHIKSAKDFVLFRLPVHGFGGEFTWITSDGETLYMVDAD